MYDFEKKVEKTIEFLCDFIRSETEKENTPEELVALAEVIASTAELIKSLKI